jgi:hypothetical protein
MIDSDVKYFSFLNSANRAERDVRSTEDVLAESQALNEEYERYTILIAHVVSEYRKFSELRDEVESAWALDPAFDSRRLAALQQIGDVWFQCFRHASRVVRRICQIGAETDDCRAVARIYSDMLAIDMMDVSEIPCHVQQVGREALAELECCDLDADAS